jgi:BirA family transcriptional regulator, biotin operon repressor / biotin---[acetyl-CoA-carboxylase] ligase
VLGATVRALLEMWDLFGTHGLGAFLQGWARLDALQGEQIVIVDSGRMVMSGRADGIDASGALRVCTDAGVRLASVGDVSARRVGV